MKLNWTQPNPEVLVTTDPITKVGKDDIEWLKVRALANPRQRVRLCAHQEVSDPVHEMIIVHAYGAYVRPHKHLNKSESFHVLEGAADAVFFNDDGTVTSIIPMGDYASEDSYYYRISTPVFHTLLIRSEVLVFHETAKGPFQRADTVFAPWSPDDSNAADVENYLGNLERSIKKLRVAQEAPGRVSSKQPNYIPGKV